MCDKMLSNSLILSTALSYFHLPLSCLQIQQLTTSLLSAVLEVENYISYLSSVTPYYTTRLSFPKVPPSSLTAPILHGNGGYSAWFLPLS